MKMNSKITGLTGVAVFLFAYYGTAQNDKNVIDQSAAEIESAGTEAAAKMDAVSEIAAKVKDMNVTDLQEMAESYKTAIESKIPTMEDLKVQLKQIPIDQIAGEKAQALKTQIEGLTQNIQESTEILNICIESLKTLGVNVSSLAL